MHDLQILISCLLCATMGYKMAIQWKSAILTALAADGCVDAIYYADALARGRKRLKIARLYADDVENNNVWDNAGGAAAVAQKVEAELVRRGYNIEKAGSKKFGDRNGMYWGVEIIITT